MRTKVASEGRAIDEFLSVCCFFLVFLCACFGRSQLPAEEDLLVVILRFCFQRRCWGIWRVCWDLLVSWSAFCSHEVGGRYALVSQLAARGRRVRHSYFEYRAVPPVVSPFCFILFGMGELGDLSKSATIMCSLS